MGRSIVAIAGGFLVAHMVIAPVAAQPPIAATEGGARSEWIEYQAWGGGARFLFSMDGSHGPGARSLRYMGGGAPQFVLGCSGPDPSRSHWRLRVDFTPPGSGISAEDERLAERGRAHYFGASGAVVLRDEMDREMGRFPLRRAADSGGLETAALSRAQVRRFLDASAVRAVTPRLQLEAGTVGLRRTVRAMQQTPCSVLD